MIGSAHATDSHAILISLATGLPWCKSRKRFPVQEVAEGSNFDVKSILESPPIDHALRRKERCLFAATHAKQAPARTYSRSPSFLAQDLSILLMATNAERNKEITAANLIVSRFSFSLELVVPSN
jgi:hypothetical protein